MEGESDKLVRMLSFPLTQEEFAARRVIVAREQNVDLSGTEGKLSRFGVTAGWQYADGLLTVTVLEKPGFVSVEYCEKEMRKMLGL